MIELSIYIQKWYAQEKDSLITSITLLLSPAYKKNKKQ